MKTDPLITGELTDVDTWVGRPIPRLEDDRLLQGQGRYVEDITLPRQLFAQFVRSPHAHAEIKSIDFSKARLLPGVVSCIAARDMPDVGPITPNWVLPGTLSKGRQVLAEERVRYVGEPVAMVIAESEAAAVDAAFAVQIDYQELPHVLNQDEALLENAVLLHEDIPQNRATTFRRGQENYEEASSDAALKLKFDIRNQRLVPFPLECRAVNADFDSASGRMTVYIGQQLPHMFRRMLAEAIAFPEHKLRVISPDVGGGFGAKMHFYSEDVAITYASRKLGRPVKWSERRRENAVATSHGRDHITTIEVAAEADGKITAMKVRSRANVGAYLSSMGVGIPTINVALFVLGVYDIPHADVAVDCVYTNTPPVDAYRGAGRPEAAYIIERTIDRVARELGLDPAHVRQKNFVTEAKMPHRNVVGGMLDVGRYHATLSRAMDVSDYEKFAALKAEASDTLLGIGIGNYTETCGVGPGELQAMIGFDRGGYESALVRIQSDGRAVVMSGSHSHGQGHVTVYAQIAADALGLRPEQVEVIQGDTDLVPQGVGTFNSRSVVVGGSAVRVASERVAKRMKMLAAHLLQASVEDVILQEGAFIVQETNRSIAFADVSRTAWLGHNVPRDQVIGLEETEFYHPRAMSAPYGAHIAKVSVDRETGEISLLEYLAVDDCGTVINPLLARGQVHGGIVQGIGQALFEDGTPLPDGSMPAEQAIPRIDVVPIMKTEHTVTPSWTNPLGAKGIGESGAIGAPPAIVNAVLDALWPLGVRDLDMPLTPERVLAAIQTAENVK
ncbi:MAG: xanthine dehydrogenase family protein molybdopterin-binding subunit [Sneathiella sp.]